MKLISVIVSTYNSPVALNLCIRSLLEQSDGFFEIIIADDGSGQETSCLINDFIINQDKIKIYHVYQEDKGFRLSAIRNQAVLISKGEYLLFLDGDCVFLPSFVKKHRHLMQSNHFVAGNRVLLSKNYTESIFNKQIYINKFSFFYFFVRWVKRDINRLIPLISLPLGKIRTLQKEKWNKVVGCNIGVYKKDFLAVNGFDESFEGWGYEDSDFAIRLINAGVKRKEGRFCVPALHLWHKTNQSSKKDINYNLMVERSKNKSIVFAEKGISQYSGSIQSD